MTGSLQDVHTLEVEIIVPRRWVSSCGLRDFVGSVRTPVHTGSFERTFSAQQYICALTSGTRS